jgi:putative membrane protein insertion efficiency factor
VSVASAIGRALLIPPIRFYRRFISPALPPACRYIPSCSQYAIEAIELHGPVKGSWLATRRICRCHPWGGHGWDPVPGSADAGDGAPAAGSQEKGRRGGRGRGDRVRAGGLLLTMAVGCAILATCSYRSPAERVAAIPAPVWFLVTATTASQIRVVGMQDRSGMLVEHALWLPADRCRLDPRIRIGDPVQITPLPDGGVAIGR